MNKEKKKRRKEIKEGKRNEKGANQENSVGIRPREEVEKRGKEKKKKEREGVNKHREKKKGLSFFSKIYGNRVIGFHRSKRQSRSTHRELHVGTKILEFRQTPRGREFSYFDYFSPKGYLMAWGFL